jgi:3-oxoacyl-[acyl-carrier-protein] synthase III
MVGAEIIGFGHYAPDQVVTSAYLEVQLGLEAGWIARRTGIVERRYAAPHQALTDLAFEAGERALQMAGLARDQVVLTLLATSTPDHLLPPSAPLLAHKLGLSRSGGIDLAGACAGFLYALALADGYVKTHRAPVLVVAANILSRRINPAERGSAILFADAAGAVLLAPTNRKHAGVRGITLASSGADYGLIGIPAGGSRQPFAPGLPLIDTQMFITDGKTVFAKAIAMMVASSEAALVASGMAASEITHLIPHQANARMTAAVAHQLGIPERCALSTIGRFGNSSAATIPFTLSALASERGYARGDAVLMTAAGAGLTGGALVWGW